MNKVLIIIDAQEDFVRGTLRNEDAIAALPTLNKIVRYAKDNKFKGIIYTADTHFNDYLTTQEGRNLPIEHCLYHTPGWAIVPEAEYEKDSLILLKDSFGYKHWDALLKILEAEEIWVCGFCTDICVISNVLMLKANYPEKPIIVFEDACAGVTPEKHNAAIEVMKSCQIKVKKWDEL